MNRRDLFKWLGAGVAIIPLGMAMKPVKRGLGWWQPGQVVPAEVRVDNQWLPVKIDSVQHYIPVFK